MPTNLSKEALPAAPGFSPALRRSVGVVMIGATLSLLDTTIVNVAVHSLADDLNTNLNSVQWVVTAYLLALAAAIPVTGWAARRVGAERLYVAAMVIFTLGSVLCACSTGIGTLIAARALQGIGGGAIMPVGTIIWAAQASRKQMGKVMALIAIPMILAPALGPVLGGLLIQHIGWQAIFWLNVPLGILGIILALALLPLTRGTGAGRLDTSGLLLSSIGIVGITYGLAEFGTAGEMTTAAVTGLGVGIPALAVFVIHALRSDHPLLDMRLYSSQAFSAASLATFALGAANYGGMILMPLYLQTVRGEDVIMAGLLVAPTALGALVAAPFTDRWHAGVTSLTGALILTLATIPFLFLDAHTSYPLLCAIMVVRGIGFSLSIIPVMTAAYQALQPAQIADATPQLNIQQRIGGAIGTAVFTVVLATQLKNQTTTNAMAAGFATTFWWVFASTVIAVIPAIFLVIVERRDRRNSAKIMG